MTVWIKGDKSEIELNDEPATIEEAKRLNWFKKEVKKRGRPPTVKREDVEG